MGHASYQELLDELIAIRDTPHRSDPERAVAMQEAHTSILQALLEKLRDNFDPPVR